MKQSSALGFYFMVLGMHISRHKFYFIEKYFIRHKTCIIVSRDKQRTTLSLFIIMSAENKPTIYQWIPLCVYGLIIFQHLLNTLA
jgi:hypothetical protein